MFTKGHCSRLLSDCWLLKIRCDESSRPGPGLGWLASRYPAQLNDSSEQPEYDGAMAVNLELQYSSTVKKELPSSVSLHFKPHHFNKCTIK